MFWPSCHVPSPRAIGRAIWTSIIDGQPSCNGPLCSTGESQLSYFKDISRPGSRARRPAKWALCLQSSSIRLRRRILPAPAAAPRKVSRYSCAIQGRPRRLQSLPCAGPRTVAERCSAANAAMKSTLRLWQHDWPPFRCCCRAITRGLQRRRLSASARTPAVQSADVHPACCQRLSPTA